MVKDDGRAIENAFLQLVVDSDPKTAAALLGAGESTVYRQFRAVHNGELLGGALRKRVQAWVLRSAEPGLGEGGELGSPESTVGPPGEVVDESADDVGVVTTLVDWAADDITEARRLLRQELHGDDELQPRGSLGTDSPMARASRLIGVIPEAEAIDYAELYGDEVSGLLTHRSMLLSALARNRTSAGIFRIYEHHMGRLVYLEDLADLRRLEFRLVAEFEITLPPYEVPLDDMQRMDVLEDLTRQIRDLEREIWSERRELFLADLCATVAWWAIRTFYPLPRGPAVEERSETALDAGDAPEGDEQRTLWRRWRNISFALGRKRHSNRVFRPYQAHLYHLAYLEALLECMRLEIQLVRRFGFQLRYANDPVARTSVASLGELDALEKRITHLRRMKAIVALPVSLWWWLCRLSFRTLVPRRLLRNS